MYIKAMAMEDGPGEDTDVEAGSTPPIRPMNHVNAMKVSLAMVLVLTVNGLAVSRVCSA